MKKLLIILVVASMFSAGCKAFNENYEHGSTDDAEVLTTLESTNTDTETTVCAAMENVIVEASLNSGFVTETILSTLEEDVMATAIAKKLEDDIVKITISAEGQEKVSIVLKKIDRRKFVACSMAYEGSAVASGTITVDSFNRGTKAVNAGTFTFEPAKDEGATKVNKAFFSRRAVKSEIKNVEGSYYVEGLQE